MTNILLDTDAYKYSHYLQYPDGTEYTNFYFESRGSEFKDFDDVVWFGIQTILLDFLSKRITHEWVDEAKEITQNMGIPFNETGFRYIVDRHMGVLPLKVDSVPEGTIVPMHNVLLQVINTDPLCYWLPGFVETVISRVWYPTTVATISKYAKRYITKYLEETSDSMDGLPFKLHDFGSRGVSSQESARIGGMAHLVNFLGTDTTIAVAAASNYYQAKSAGFSIPATEHSTITSWTREGESDAYENLIDKFSGEGKLVACVSDSYDLFNAIRNIWGGKLKDKVKNNGGTIVIRPDSGNPVNIVEETITTLMDVFGYSINKKGYYILPNYVRVIQGDGININSIPLILENLKRKRISTDNLAMGMGGGLLQNCTRDTFKFAMKCSAIYVNGVWRDVYKDPVTDSKKRSKRGILGLTEEMHTDRIENCHSNILEPIYWNGITKLDTFEKIRERANY